MVGVFAGGAMLFLLDYVIGVRWFISAPAALATYLVGRHIAWLVAMNLQAKRIADRMLEEFRQDLSDR